MKKILLLVAALVMNVTEIFSQTLNYRWLKDFGIGGNNYGISGQAVAGSANDLYLLAWRQAVGSTIERYDSTGSLQWSQQINNIWQITGTNNGQVILNGSAWGTVSIGQTTIVSPEIQSMIMLVDQNGEVVNYALYEDYYTMVHEVKVSETGDIYVQGIVADTLDFNGYFIINNSGKEYTHFIMKLDNALHPQWHHILHVPVTMNFGEMAVHNSDVYLSGVFRDTLSISNNLIHMQQTGAEENFILQMNSQGQVLWYKILSGAVINRIEFDQRGDLYVTGGFGDTLFVDSHMISSKACHQHECSNAYALKFSTDRKVSYLSAIDQNHNSGVRSTAVSPEGNLYFTGDFSVIHQVGDDTIFSGPQNSYNNGFHTFLARLDHQGKLDWHIVPTQHFASGVSLSIQKTGDLFWSGSARRLVLATDSVGSYYTYDPHYFMARFKGPQQLTSLAERHDNGLQFWPNPSEGAISIESTAATDIARLRFYDAQGSCIMTVYPLNDQKTINVEGLVPGLYLMEAQIDNRLHYRKVVVR